ncbi:MAG: hypothetical protein JSU81_04750 [Candidatus Coatesbacteria bacterium]|nr:MAG: hypothetical protein JSU81_04750 [Candidatus Coatesbacteria bacterium]
MAKKANTSGRKPSAAATTAALLGVFAAAHLVYYILGIRFDDTSLLWYWQFLDPELLRDRLLESVFYLHSQPPLFNLFLGAALKVSAGQPRAVFHGAFVAFGVTLYLSLFWLQVRLGVTRRVAAATSAFFLLSPSFVLYEHWLFYTFPLAAVMTLATLLFYEAAIRRRTWAYLAFFAAAFVLCGTRHIFHLAYYLLAAAALALACRGARRKVVLAAAAPFVILLSFYVKNAVVFREFGLSSWSGMNLWQMTGFFLHADEREHLTEAGELSPVATIPTFSDWSLYPSEYEEADHPGEAEALRRIYKSTGPPNYNYRGYITVAREYGRDSRVVLRRYPATYFRAQLRSWFMLFRSSSDYINGVRFLDETGNFSRLEAWNEAFDRAVYGKIHFNPDATGLLSRFGWKLPPFTLYLYLALGVPLLAYYAFRRASRRAAPEESLAARARRWTLGYVFFNIAYVVLVTNLFSWAENNRTRFIIDPLVVAVLGLFVQHYIVWASRRKG